MNVFDIINLSTIGATCWCAAFAATNFGNKFGRLWGFQNNMGYTYISDADSEKVDLHYEEIVKVAQNDKNAPLWAKNKDELKDRCSRYQNSLRYWGETVKYCVIKKTVRHKLIEEGLKFQKGVNPEEGKCKDDLLNSFSDSKNDLAILIARRECKLEEINKK